MTNDTNRPEIEHEPRSQRPSNSKLTINRADLTWAVSQGMLSDSQADKLWSGLSEKLAGQTKFGFANIGSYLAAAVILLAMGGFMALFAHTPESVTAVSFAYMVIFAGAGWYISREKNQIVPGGLLMTLAVSMTPIVGLSWLSIGGGMDLTTNQQLIVEFATILAGVAALQVVRFPFITAPIYASMWFMAMTLTNTYGGGFGWLDQDNMVVSMVFGALVCAIAYLVDKKTKEDYSFWGYFFGMLMLWGAWTFMNKGGELGNFAYFLTNIVFMVVSVVLNRKIFLVYGAIGSVGYLGYLTWELFEGSAAFLVGLFVLGVALMYATILYRRHGHVLEGAILKFVNKR